MEPDTEIARPGGHEGRKEKMMDNLDVCVKEAAEKGISYGKLMADKPLPEPKNPKEPNDGRAGTRICAQCGKEFPIYNKRPLKYCSPERRTAAAKDQAEARRARLEADAEDPAPVKIVPVGTEVDGDLRAKIRRYQKFSSRLMDLLLELVEEG